MNFSGLKKQIKDLDYKFGGLLTLISNTKRDLLRLKGKSKVEINPLLQNLDILNSKIVEQVNTLRVLQKGPLGFMSAVLDIGYAILTGKDRESSKKQREQLQKLDYTINNNIYNVASSFAKEMISIESLESLEKDQKDEIYQSTLKLISDKKRGDPVDQDILNYIDKLPGDINNKKNVYRQMFIQLKKSNNYANKDSSDQIEELQREIEKVLSRTANIVNQNVKTAAYHPRVVFETYLNDFNTRKEQLSTILNNTISELGKISDRTNKQDIINIQKYYGFVNTMLSPQNGVIIMSLTKVISTLEELIKTLEKEVIPLPPPPTKTPKTSSLKKKIIKAEEDSKEKNTKITPQEEKSIEEKVQEVLFSPSMFTKIEEIISPFIKSNVDEFVAKNKDKAFDYSTNSEMLINDIEEQLPIIKWIDRIDIALDVMFWGTTIASIISSIGSFGLTSPGSAAYQGIAIAVRTALKKGLKTYGKEILVKIIGKMTLKAIAKLALSSGIKIGKDLLVRGTKLATMIVSYDLFTSMISSATLSAIKNIIINKGSSEFHLPQELIATVVKPDTTEEAAKKAFQSFKEKAISDLKSLFSTEAGFKTLAFNVALGQLWKASGTSSEAVKFAMQRTLNNHLKDKKYHKIETLKEKARKKLSPNDEKALLTESEIKTFLNKSFIPKNVHNNYITYFSNLLKDKEDLTKDKAESIVKKNINSTDITISSIYDNIGELAMIEFIIQYNKYLKDRQTDLQPLFEDITDEKISSIKSLMIDNKVGSIEDLAKHLYKQKKIEIQNQIKNISTTARVDPDKMYTYFVEKADTMAIKQKLYRQIFKS